MFSETIQTSRLKPSETALGILGFLGLTILLVWGVSKVIAATGWRTLEGLPVIVLGVLAYGLYQYYAVSYRYTLTEEALILEQVVRGLPRLHFSVPLSGVRRLEANGTPESGVPVERLMPRRRPSTVFLLADHAEGRKRQFRFQPSDALAARLAQAVQAARDRASTAEDCEHT